MLRLLPVFFLLLASALANLMSQNSSILSPPPQNISLDLPSNLSAPTLGIWPAPPAVLYITKNIDANITALINHQYDTRVYAQIINSIGVLRSNIHSSSASDILHYRDTDGVVIFEIRASPVPLPQSAAAALLDSLWVATIRYGAATLSGHLEIQTKQIARFYLLLSVDER